jgi:hypothetical protein
MSCGLDVEPEVALRKGQKQKENMKKTIIAKYLLAYVGLAGFAVTVEASTTIVTPSSPGSWNYETISYTATYGSYTISPGNLPVVTSPAAPGTGGSVQLINPVNVYGAGAAQISTTALDGLLLSSVNTLGYAENTVVNNGQQNPYIRIQVSLNVGGVAGAGGQDALFFEPSYQTALTGNPGLPDQGATSLSTWQTWNAKEGGWWDNNGIFTPGAYESPTHPGVNSLAAFLNLYPDATIVDNSFTAGDGGISIVMGWDGGANEGYVQDVTINSTTYDFEPAAPVPEASTMVAGVLMLLPFGASALRILRKKQSV